MFADVDECMNSPCDINANCTNVVGSYTCQCLDGYTGDGLLCAGKRLCIIKCLFYRNECTVSQYQRPQYIIKDW